MRPLHVQYLRQIFELSHSEGSPCDQIHLGRSQLSAGPCRSGQKPALWWHFLPQNLQLTSSSDQTVNVWCSSRQILMIHTWSWSHNHVHLTRVWRSKYKETRNWWSKAKKVETPVHGNSRQVKGSWNPSSLFPSMRELFHPAAGVYSDFRLNWTRGARKEGEGEGFDIGRGHLLRGDSAGKMRNCQQTEAHWRD